MNIAMSIKYYSPQSSPEWTPSNVALTEVLMTSGLLYQQLHLLVDWQSLLVREVITYIEYL